MFLEVTHSITKHKALLLPNKVLGVSFSDDMKQTFIIADAGSIFPVSESAEYIKQELIRLLNLKESV